MQVISKNDSLVSKVDLVFVFNVANFEKQKIEIINTSCAENSNYHHDFKTSKIPIGVWKKKIQVSKNKKHNFR